MDLPETSSLQDSQLLDVPGTRSPYMTHVKTVSGETGKSSLSEENGGDNTPRLIGSDYTKASKVTLDSNESSGSWRIRQSASLRKRSHTVVASRATAMFNDVSEEAVYVSSHLKHIKYVLKSMENMHVDDDYASDSKSTAIEFVGTRFDFSKFQLEDEHSVKTVFDMFDLSSCGSISVPEMFQFLKYVIQAYAAQQKTPPFPTDDRELLNTVHEWFSDVYASGQTTMNLKQFEALLRRHDHIVGDVKMVDDFKIRVSKDLSIWNDSVSTSNALFEKNSELHAATLNQLVERLTNGTTSATAPNSRNAIHFSRRRMSVSVATTSVIKRMGTLLRRSRAGTVSGTTVAELQSEAKISKVLQRTSVASLSGGDSPTMGRSGRRGGLQHAGMDIDIVASAKPGSAASISVRETEESFERTFLLTYPTFATGDQVVAKLLQRFNVPAHIDVNLRAKIQLHVCQVLIRWMETFPKDFNSGMINSLNTFANDTLKDAGIDFSAFPPMFLGAIAKAGNQEATVKMYPFLCEMMSNIKLSTFRSTLHMYHNCFTGFDLVGWILSWFPGYNHAAATKMCEGILADKIICHVYDKKFEASANSYYQFHKNLYAKSEGFNLMELSKVLDAKPDPLSAIKTNLRPGACFKSYSFEIFYEHCKTLDCHDELELLVELRHLKFLASAEQRARLDWLLKAFFDASASNKPYYGMLSADKDSQSGARNIEHTTFFDLQFQSIHDYLFKFVDKTGWATFVKTERWLLLCNNGGIREELKRTKPFRILLPRNEELFDDEQIQEVTRISYSSARRRSSVTSTTSSNNAPASAQIFESPGSAYTDVIKFNPHKVIDPKSGLFIAGTEFLDLEELDVARQMTILDREFFVKIERIELLNQVWSKPDRFHMCQNLLQFIGRFNDVSAWVSVTILGCSKVKKRARMMERFLRIAIALKDLRNFAGMMSIYASLNSAPISRLKHTKALLTKPVLQWAKELEEFMASDSNFKTYRDAIKKCELSGEPAIPYLGMCLSDLTFIEEGNSNKIAGMINIERRSQTAEILSSLLSFQEREFSLTAIPPILTLLRNLPTSTEEKLYSLSQPRGAEAKDIE